MQVSGEPKLQWQGGATLRVEKAIDDRGQSLKLESVAATPSSQAQLVEELVFLPNGGVTMATAGTRTGAIAIRVRKGTSPASVLAELTGSVAGQVRVTEQLAAIDNPIEAGKTVARGPNGVTMGVTDVTRVGSGDTKFSVALTFPPDVQAAQGAVVANRGPVQIQGQGVVIQRMVIMGGVAPLPSLPAGTNEFSGLSLVDAQGRRFEIGQANQDSTQIGPQGFVYNLTVVFRTSARDFTEPAKLVFTGTRPTTVEVPFVLRNVPLP